MKTIMNKQQQATWIENNWSNTTIKHKWSSRGYGNSKILNARDDVIGAANGRGYDRFGAALGNAITDLFPDEVLTLAKRHCVGKRRNYKQPKNSHLYGLFYDAIKGRAWLDGGCGDNQMRNILNAIGFGLDYVGEDKKSNNGVVFYTLRPVSKHEKEWLK